MNYTNPDFVAANQNGTITPEQVKLVNSALLGKTFTSGCVTFLGAFFLVILVIPALAAVFTQLDIADESVDFILLGTAAGLAVLVIAVWSVWLLNCVIRTQSDLNNSRIAHARGQIVWRGSKYTFRTDEQQQLNLIDVCPAPMYEYQAHYLESSRHLLSLSRLEMLIDGPAKFAAILGKAFRFDDDSLAQNKQGLLSDHQRQHMTRLRFFSAALLGSLALALLGVPFILLLGDVELQSVSIVLAILSLVVLLLVWLVVRQLRQAFTIMNLGDNAVTMSEGVGSKYSRTTGSGKSRRTVYYCQVGTQSFVVNMRAYEAFIPQINYRAYYLPTPYEFLSLEAIG
jgi:hypothetical protein